MWFTDKCNQLEWLKNMQRVRTLEELSENIDYPYIGEEAVTTGVMSLLNHRDNVGGIYREQIYALLRGIKVKNIIENNYWGNRGSLQIFHNGGQLYSGFHKSLELAYQAKNNNEDRRTVCFFNENAIQDDSFLHVVNMAQQWEIPIFFCCENAELETNIASKIRNQFIEAEVVDGVDILSVIEKSNTAFDYIQNEHRPYFLEFKTHRYIPRSKKISYCPIENLKNKMITEDFLTEIEWKKIKENIENEISCST
jgi:TPP-dependent pyruvate/acetoin dehydrogenase alpha subunit